MVRPQSVSPKLDAQDDAPLPSSKVDLKVHITELLSLPDTSAGILPGAHLSMDDDLSYTIYAAELDFPGEKNPLTDLHSFNAWSGSVDEPTFSQAM
ncbi:hypothetical protein P7C70_g6623, partial [Phenoliferia sp. Uapishka_3]